MKMKVRLICYGDSTENLNLSMKYKVIGTKRNEHFSDDEIVYLIKRDNGAWNVYARAQVEGKTDDYPFNDGYAYYTYKLSYIEACVPFSINDICRERLGSFWGLKLQQPSIIEIQEFIDEVNAKFIPINS